MRQNPKPQDDHGARKVAPETGAKAGEEQDGGESILSGRSREHHSEVPEDVELPEKPQEDDASRPPNHSTE